MNLNDYLTRINYNGTLEPTKGVLFALHRAHLSAIAYENLDIHLGNPVTVDIEQIFDKIVHRGRGGWCFEMNGLFAWALREIGFDVTMYAATVGRATRKPVPTAVEQSTEPAQKTTIREGDHLVLKVKLDQPYLADVGFGIGFYEPLPLTSDNYRQDFLDVELFFERERWHFENDPKAGPGYDFPVEPQSLSDFGDACDWLQTDPNSGFVRTTVCHRVQKGKLRTMRGLTYKMIQPAGTTTRIIEKPEEYAQIIQDEFGLPIQETAQLWETAHAMHQRWLAENPY